ncbi:MAG: DUF1844 domain-containing protein [Candidatus Firestonebacteria bacterium]
MSDEMNEKDLFSVMFLQLVYSFQNMAVMQLGKLMNPATNKVEKDLVQAKGTIDLLRMLKEKTKGNLSPKEGDFLDQILLNLQLNYADEAAKGEKGADGANGKTTN